MAKAKKLPSGSWRVLVYDYTDENGKRHYQSFTSDDPSAKGKREAEYAAAEFANHKSTQRNKNTMTFGDALDAYIANRSSVLSPATIREYKRSRKIDIQELMSVRVCDITQELIQKLINEEAQKHAPKTVRNIHGLISAVMKVYRPDFALNTALPKKIRPKINVPTDDQIRTLMQYVKDSELEIPVLLAAFGPMRRGEICALDTDHIHKNFIHVEFSMVMDENKKWIIKQPKSYAGNRIIEFPQFVIERINASGKKGRIVSLSPSQISDRFIDALKRAGIPHFRFHDLRHYNASISHAIGIPDQYIMARGGWASDTVLKNVYRHTMSDRSNQMNQIANQHFEMLMQHEMQHEK